MKKFLVSLYFGIGHVCTAIALAAAALFVLIFILGNIPHHNTRKAQQSLCLSNQHQIGLAMAEYEFDNDTVLPPASSWMDAVEPSYVRDDHPMHCPSVGKSSRTRYGYAFNSTLGGRNVWKMTGSRTTPMVYDSTNTDRNAHDPLSSLPMPGRHLGKNNLLYLDGHVKEVAP